MNRKTVGRNFLKLSETTMDVKRDADRNETELGTWQTDVSVAFSEKLLTRPDQTLRLTPRNQGGKRVKRCKDCGSENLVEETKMICQDCGTIQSETLRPANPPEYVQLNECNPTEEQNHGPREQIQEILSPSVRVQPTSPPVAQAGEEEPRDNLSPVFKPEKLEDNLSEGSMPLPSQKPATPPEGEVELPTRQSGDGGLAGFSLITAQILLDIAGDAITHIIMNENPRVTKKYLTVHTSLRLSDVNMHLAGTKTIGASLEYADGTTRALCFDADTQEDWQKLQEAANELQTAGYAPFLERSPQRGGHLWIIFERNVQASVAKTMVCQIAPMLADIAEYWPRGNGAKVRLPGGKYVTPGFSEWCRLSDASGAELSTFPLSEASLIPEQPAEAVLEKQAMPPLRSKPDATMGVDDYHRKKYHDAHFWFAWTPAQLAEWYQSRTTIIDRCHRNTTETGWQPGVERERPAWPIPKMAPAGLISEPVHVERMGNRTVVIV